MTVGLHFQCGCFLADYAAMQQALDSMQMAIPAETGSQPDAPQACNPTNHALARAMETTIARAMETTTTGPAVVPAVEWGGPAGLEPTRFGDWEKAGRCIDF